MQTAVSLDEAWNLGPQAPPAPPQAPPQPPKPEEAQQLGAAPRVAVDAQVLLHILDELQALRSEQARNAQALWITIAAGLVLVLCTLSSISRTLNQLDGASRRSHWSRG
tara:strand:- start:560 stop:886 length:327 start_codon:yes stop_codon:yes gene_type:complete